MKQVTCQSEFDAAVKAGETDFEITAAVIISVNVPNTWIRIIKAVTGSSVVARESSRIEAWGSSSVVAWGSSSVVARESSRIEAWESSSVVAWGSSSVVARESSRIEARGSSSVVAWGSSSVVARESSRIEARGSSSVVARESSRIEAWESSSVVAWGSSSVVARESSRIEARGSSSVVARESSSVVARGFVSLIAFGGTLDLSAKCHVFIRNKKAKIKGGIQTDAIVKTAQDWCDFYGVEVKNGVAIVYKAVNDDFSSQRDSTFKYTPGTRPIAPQYDDKECSHGLHASPSPKMAKYEFFYSATKFVACPVRAKDMMIFPDGSYPSKVKFPKVCAPVYEVNEDGERV